MGIEFTLQAVLAGRWESGPGRSSAWRAPQRVPGWRFGPPPRVGNRWRAAIRGDPRDSCRNPSAPGRAWRYDEPRKAVPRATASADVGETNPGAGAAAGRSAPMTRRYLAFSLPAFAWLLVVPFAAAGQGGRPHAADAVGAPRSAGGVDQHHHDAPRAPRRPRGPGVPHPGGVGGAQSRLRDIGLRRRRLQRLLAGEGRALDAHVARRRSAGREAPGADSRGGGACRRPARGRGRRGDPPRCTPSTPTIGASRAGCRAP